MRVLHRNFIRLLSTGTFGDTGTLEAMSEYKWSKLMMTADALNVGDLIGSGIAKTNTGLIPQGINKAAESRAEQDKTTTTNDAASLKLAAAKRAKKFSNFYLNRKYNKIVFNEIHSIDTSVDTLVFLNKLVDNINTLLNKGISIKTLADIGRYLRTNGEKIDFIKAERWIKQLKIRKMADLVGCGLMALFNFEKDELPFMKDGNKKLQRRIDKDFGLLFDTAMKPAKHHRAHSAGGINPITMPDTSPMHYFSLFPLETSSRLMANVVKSISNIDE